MNKMDIQLLLQYNQWTNAKILKAAANVTQEEYLAPGSFPHGGLRGTLVHALFAEWIWRNRWEGISPTKRLKPEDFPTFESLRTRWAEEEQALMSFVDGLTDERLESEFSYTATDGVPHKRILWQAMAHLVNHGTQHRTEAAAILTDLGHSPGDIDMIYFLIDSDNWPQSR
ncbi:MAG TPA: DinB family protein [Anaerolineales bacterium]|nr:DinB family protein [Anaerolineales bacterium]